MIGDEDEFDDFDDVDMGDDIGGGDDDDFGFEDFTDDAAFDDFESEGGSLADAWKNNPFFKIGAIVGGLVLVIVLITMMGGDGDETPQSVMRGKSDVSDVPGSGQVTTVYKEAVEETNVRRVEDAIKTGGSALPTPVSTDEGRLTIDEPQAEKEDPLDRWRRIQEERQKQQAEEQAKLQAAQQKQAMFQAQQQAQQAPAEQGKAIDALAKAMAQQMETVLGSAVPQAPRSIEVTPDDFIEQEERKKQREAAEQGLDGSGDGTVTADGGDSTNQILIPAGTIEYGQLMIEANSDAGGTILAEMASGPYAGSRLLGTFETRDDFLVLTFNTIMIDDVGYSANIVALNPDKASVAMVTDIDRRYFRRIILPAAAKFVEGMGGAIAESASSTTTIDGGTGVATTSQEDLDVEEELAAGLEEAAGKASEILDEEGQNTQPLITVAPGTAMGLLFVDPVLEQ
ncbi:MAG: type IV secretion protein DotG [Alphaproteobacteria bacterium]|jgi:intracellular multiplication protein IcmE|nr:type IV secretion protein DotG [Alphaproteobacteria bacterium]MDP7221659.1 type IV secretion protein DotG [Alphaproteobacteria bacterium]